MKLTVSQKIVLGLVVILVLCLLIVWVALRKPLERKKVFAVESHRTELLQSSGWQPRRSILEIAGSFSFTFGTAANFL